MNGQYVEQRDGDYYLGDSRVSLASVVYAFLDGHSPESILDCFPLLTLEQIYGALAYYLGHRAEIDAHLAERRAEYDAKRRAAREADPAFYERFALRRRQLLQGQP
jgi:uncharacterized protein (DUF433 family)